MSLGASLKQDAIYIATPTPQGQENWVNLREGISVAVHPGPGSDPPPFAMVYGYIHFPIKVPLTPVEMKLIL